jgi:two-component system osmolarity sensor histidine kinase EnvZ
MILWNIGLSMLFLTMAVVFMKNQIKPIRKLATAAEAFGKGEHTQKYFKLAGAKEVRQATSAFIKMRSRIIKQIEQRTDMLSGISHDLRTPLTRMKLEISMMGNKKEHKDLLKDITEMEEMLNSYLSFARGENEEGTEKINFNNYLSDIVKTECKYHNKGNIDLHFEEEIEVNIKPKSFKRALTNIISNGCKYANNVWIYVGIRNDFLEIKVDDDGKGINPNQYKNVFKPFVRLEKSRNKKTGGIGLGLSVARDVVNNHGGTITLAESPYKGLRVIIKIPM